MGSTKPTNDRPPPLMMMSPQDSSADLRAKRKKKNFQKEGFLVGRQGDDDVLPHFLDDYSYYY